MMAVITPLTAAPMTKVRPDVAPLDREAPTTAVNRRRQRRTPRRGRGSRGVRSAGEATAATIAARPTTGTSGPRTNVRYMPSASARASTTLRPRSTWAREQPRLGHAQGAEPRGGVAPRPRSYTSSARLLATCSSSATPSAARAGATAKPPSRKAGAAHEHAGRRRRQCLGAHGEPPAPYHADGRGAVSPGAPWSRRWSVAA